MELTRVLRITYLREDGKKGSIDVKYARPTCTLAQAQAIFEPLERMMLTNGGNATFDSAKIIEVVTDTVTV